MKRRSVKAKIQSDPTACEKFLNIVLEGYILSLVMQEFQLTSLDDSPNASPFTQDFLKESLHEREQMFLKAIRTIVDRFTHTFALEKPSQEVDHVVAYSKEVLTLGLLYMEFSDSIHEGDGGRILRCWRYMLLLFKAQNKQKYAIQALTMLAQYHFIFNDRMKHQLLWSRTINVHGRPGKNIPMDLHMEHLNRQLKNSISHLGSNVTDTTIQRVGLCLRKLMDIKANYDQCTGLPIESGYYSSQSNCKDLAAILEQLNNSDIFFETKGRQHSQFPKFTSNVVASVKKSELQIWMKKQIKVMINYS